MNGFQKQPTLLSLPWELHEQILGPFLRASTVDGSLQSWLLGDNPKDELSLRAVRLYDTLTLRLVCKQFCELCDSIEKHNASRSRVLADFGGLYRASSPRILLANCTRHILRQGWGKDNAAELKTIMSLSSFSCAIRTLELSFGNLLYLENAIKLCHQFPNLEKVVIEAFGQSQSLDGRIDKSDIAGLSIADLGYFSVEYEVNQLVPWLFDLPNHGINIFVRRLVDHRHRGAEPRKYTLIVIGEFVTSGGRRSWQIKPLHHRCMERQPFFHGITAYKFTPGQRCKIRLMTEESICAN